MELLKRNKLFISDETQKKVEDKTVLAIGCGLSSQIVELAARTGFKNFIVVDGDEIDSTNLNRQSFYLDELGSNKALALSRAVKKIRDDCQITVLQKFLEEKNEIEEIVKSADIVINTADANQVIFLINEATRKEEKTEIFPLNLGFGSFFLHFSPKNPSKLKNFAESELGISAYYNLVDNTIGIENVSQYMRETFYGINPEKEEGFPQLGICTYLNAALILNSLLKEIEGLEINFINYFDPRKN